MDTFIEAFLTGTPAAIAIAVVGIVWTLFYQYSRDKTQDAQVKSSLDLEQRKFQHQREIEQLRFAYDQSRWREDLGRELTIKLLDVRMEEYSKLWAVIEEVAISKSITPEDARRVAQKIRGWRYGKGGMLAESVTRDAAYYFQQVLWEYKAGPGQYRAIRKARSVLVQALRTDLGLGHGEGGKNMVELAAERIKLREQLPEAKPERENTIIDHS